MGELISTIGVYQDFHPLNIDENYPIAQLDNPDNEEITEKTYGALKGLCEAAVQRYFPTQALIIRPGVIVGPHDPTDRFTYWAQRIAKSGEVLAVEGQSLQLIDIRDLSQWIIQMVEKRATGIYNAVGAPFSMETLLQGCPQVTLVSEAFLLKKGVKDWTEIPLWLSSKRHMPGFFRNSF